MTFWIALKIWNCSWLNNIIMRWKLPTGDTICIFCQFLFINLCRIFGGEVGEGGMVAWKISRQESDGEGNLGNFSLLVKSEEPLADTLCPGFWSISKSSLIKNTKGHGCQLCLLSNSCVRMEEHGERTVTDIAVRTIPSRFGLANIV